MRAISRRPQSTQRRPSIRSISLAASRLSSRESPHSSTSWSSGCSRSRSEAALTVCSAETTRTPVGHHLERLLGGRALPHAEHARRLAAHGGRERHRRVDQQLAGAQRAVEVGERLGLVAERHAQDHGLAPRAAAVALSLAVNAPSGTAALARSGVSAARSGSREPIAIGTPARRQPHGQAEAERARGADHRDRSRHGSGHARRV